MAKSKTTTSKSNKPKLPAGIAQLPDGRYRVRATVTRAGETREAEETLAPGATLGQAVDARAELLARLRGEVEEAERPPLFPTYALQWLERKRGRVREVTRTLKAGRVELHARPALGHLRLDEIDRRVLLRWRDQLSRSKICRPGHPRDGEPYSAALLVGVWQDTLAILRDGWAEWGLPDPSARIEPPISEKAPQRGRAPTLEEIKRLLARLEGEEPYLPALLMASTGLRQGEVRGLLWSDLDLEARVARLRAEAVKTGRPREVPLPAPVVELLRARRVELLRVQHPLLHAGLVFGTRDGRRWGTTHLTVAIRRAALQIGLERVTPHDLRRAFVTHAIEAGVNAWTLRAIVGHSTEEMTALYYRAQEDARRHALEQVWESGLGRK